MLERVSWLCRDFRKANDAGDGTCKIVFSNRSGMPYSDMKEYLNVLRDKTKLLDVQIDWQVIDSDRIESYSPGKRAGLQIADAVAGSFWYAVNPSRYGHTEDWYARKLRPVVYHHKGKYLGYGIKFWPRDVEPICSSGSQFDWLREYRQE